jgi:hypothetical protein
MNSIGRILALAALLAVASLFMTAGPGRIELLPCARPEPVAHLIEQLGSADQDAIRYAQEQLSALTGASFKTQGEWRRWYAQTVDAVLSRLETPDSHLGEAIIEAGRYRTPEAVPLLEHYLRKHTGTGITHEFTVAQALYLIGTAEAHRVLAKYTYLEEYMVGMSIDYSIASSFMHPDEAEGFIRDYHLTNTSGTLHVSLKCSGKYNFTVSVTNASSQPVSVYDHDTIYLGQLLLLRSPSGHFVRRTRTVMYKLPVRENPFVTLKPGESKTYEINCTIKATPLSFRRAFAGWQHLMLDCGDYVHFLPEEGEYEVCALYCFPRRDRPYRGQPDNTVFGRWVSEPLRVSIEW